ncbi:UvrD-helicase domain-containing protein [Hominiventricola filiformis]|uniref:DNA 3'-5' helicase n=1 Tax=Hominiventricola filiformis TaxID=2885352 RepID=A0AAE3A8Y7_9FIRM|nr:UvrD-helicase domain-containing protein [Hominiventricola filiformis]MCC2126085.1 UvrD-helicase domain-containing protein [Hominiventricola filiformis]
MNFWNKMLSNITDTVLPKKLDDDTLFLQIEEALQEEKNLWNSQQSYIDPYTVKCFQDKWHSAYSSAKKKTRGVLFSLGLSGQKIHSLAPKFIDIYEHISSKAQAFNECMIKHRVAEAAQLILPVEGKMLDDQQMRCIVKKVHNHLVLAGAGSGKTTTIVAYVKYLLKSNICMSNDILVLSFTNASALEMSERLNKEIGTPVIAQTFHKLGLDIITSVQSKKPKIYSGDIRLFARKQLNVLVQNVEYLRKLCTYLIYDGVTQKSEFDFQTEEEYQSYLKYNSPITLKKERVKSYGELKIANFLTQNGVSYVYEQAYPIDTRTSEFGQYHPDFYLPDYDLYIEYFGIDREGKVPAYFSEKNGMSATQVYQEGIKWKQELHKKNETHLIEVYAYENLEGHLLSKLEERLRNAGVIFSPMSPNEMWSMLNGTENQKLDRIAELFGTVITLAKSNECSLDEMHSRNASLKNLASIDIVIDLIKPVYNNYQAMLSASEEIDFNDMINLASHYVQNKQFIHSYKYVIVDEYQDISQARYRLLDSMRKQNAFHLFCVGDDWQSIYRFNGSDIGFILNFEKYWGISEVSRIETTYRFPQSLISVSSSFIMKNPEQKQKKLHSAIADRGFSMGKITGYTDAYAVEFLADRLKDLPPKSSILFIGRYRFDIKILESQKQFTYRYNTVLGKTEVFFSRRPDLQIFFMTVHGSKGLQADYVFLLNNKAQGMGFPSQIADAPVLRLFLDNSDHYPYAEERRLFYVAITRAKKKVWLVTIKNNESVFVKEIDEVYGKDMQKEQYICPLCGGRLIRKSGPYGEFFGCSNYSSKGCRYKRNINRSKNIGGFRNGHTI